MTTTTTDHGITITRAQVPPCPSWCRFTDHLPDHSYDSESLDGSTLSRFHISDVSGVYIAQEEFNRDGVVRFGPAHISGAVGDGDIETTADEARALAADLIAAADELDHILGLSS